MELRAHQVEIIEKARKSISDGTKRPLLFACCSFGKTIVAGEIARLAVAKNNKVLFIVHRRLLAYQTKEKFDAYGLSSSIIMAGEKTDFGCPVMITTVQTYRNRLKLKHPSANIFFHDASVIFVDECHLAIGPTFKEVYDYYQGKVIIGLTGSPARGDQRGLGEVFESIISSTSIKELTDQGYLAPVRYFAAPAPDLTKVKMTAGDYNKKELEKEMNKTQLVGDVVENWQRSGEGRQTIVFASGVKHSIHLRDEFIKIGVAAEHLDANSPHDERMEVLRQFRLGNITVVCNCQLFTEGYDADFVSCIAIARPTKSLPLWIQMAGRGQRICDGKVDCILLDFGGNIERHGFLTDDIEWSLDGKERAWKKKEPEPKEPKTVKCTVCHAVFEGVDRCPDCNSPVQKFGKKIEVVAADLEEVGGKRKMDAVERRRFLGMLLHVQRAKGYKQGWVSWKYKEKTGVFPKSLDLVAPIPPDEQFSKYLQHLNIKAAKSKQKQNSQFQPGMSQIDRYKAYL